YVNDYLYNGGDNGAASASNDRAIEAPIFWREQTGVHLGLEYPASPPCDNSPTCSPPAPFVAATPQQVTNAIGQASWLTYVGHGGRPGWGQGIAYSYQNVDNLNNVGLLPIVYSVGCQTGEFTFNIMEDNSNPIYSD